MLSFNGLNICVLNSDDHGDKITTEQLPHPGDTQSFKSQFESEPTDEERRAECRREKKRCHEPTDEEDGPRKVKGAAKSTDTSHDSTVQSGTVMSTIIKKLIRSGKISVFICQFNTVLKVFI